jgi:hypothetical protein
MPLEIFDGGSRRAFIASHDTWIGHKLPLMAVYTNLYHRYPMRQVHGRPNASLAPLPGDNARP